MNLKKGNLVKVLAGKDKNKTGEIIELIHNLNKAKVKGINMVKKHLKATKEKNKAPAKEKADLFMGDLEQGLDENAE